MSLFYTNVDKDNHKVTHMLHEGSDEVAFDPAELNVDINLMRHRARFENVINLQASDDSLEMVRKQFSGIPIHNGQVSEWWGETARFIAANFGNR